MDAAMLSHLSSIKGTGGGGDSGLTFAWLPDSAGFAESFKTEGIFELLNKITAKWKSDGSNPFDIGNTKKGWFKWLKALLNSLGEGFSKAAQECLEKVQAQHDSGHHDVKPSAGGEKSAGISYDL